MQIPPVLQHSNTDCGPACFKYTLDLIAPSKKPVDTYAFLGYQEKMVSLRQLADGYRKLELKPTVLMCELFELLTAIRLPSILFTESHFIVHVGKIKETNILMDPKSGYILSNHESFNKKYKAKDTSTRIPTIIPKEEQPPNYNKKLKKILEQQIEKQYSKLAI